MMMELLASNPNIVFDKVYPFEVRFLAYFVKMAQKVEGLNDPQNWNPESLFNSNFKSFGKFPYGKSELIELEEFKSDFFRSSWSSFSEKVLKNKPEVDFDKPVYYAEKTPFFVPDYLNKKMACKNLILLRDPRDEFLSIKAFNLKRGFLAFGWQKEDTDETFANKFCNQRKGFLSFFSRVQNDKQRFKIKYEDFVEAPNQNADNISDWLNLKLDTLSVLKGQEDFKHHMTSNNIENTIYKWKNEMSPELQNIFKDKIGEELLANGYDL